MATGNQSSHANEIEIAKAKLALLKLRSKPTGPTISAQAYEEGALPGPALPPEMKYDHSSEALAGAFDVAKADAPPVLGGHPYSQIVPGIRRAINMVADTVVARQGQSQAARRIADASANARLDGKVTETTESRLQGSRDRSRLAGNGWFSQKAFSIGDIEAAAKVDQNVARVLAEARAAQSMRRREVAKFEADKAALGDISSYYGDKNKPSRSMVMQPTNAPPVEPPKEMSDQDVADLVYQAVIQAEGGFDEKVKKQKWFGTPFGDFTAGTGAAVASAALPMAAVGRGASIIANTAKLSGPAALAAASGGTTAAIQGARISTGAQEAVDWGQVAIDTALGWGAGKLGAMREARAFKSGVKKSLEGNEVGRAALLGAQAGRALTEAEKAALQRLQSIRLAAQAKGARVADISLNLAQFMDEQQKIERGVLPARPWIDRIAEFLGGYAGSAFGRTAPEAAAQPRSKPEAWPRPSTEQRAPVDTQGIPKAGDEAWVGRDIDALPAEADPAKVGQADADAALQRMQFEIIQEAASRLPEAMTGDPSRAAIDADLQQRANIDAAVLGKLKGAAQAERRAESLRRKAIDSAGKAKREAAAEAEVRGRPATGKPVKLPPQPLTAEQWAKVSERVNQIERVQGTPATPEQYAIVQRMVMQSKPGLEAALPQKPSKRPTTGAEKDKAAAGVLKRMEADLGGGFGHFEQKVAVAQRAARLKPSANAPEMVVRKAVEVGDRAYFADGDKLTPMTPEDRSALKDAIERGDVAVVKPASVKSKLAAKGATDPSSYKVEAQIVDKAGKVRKISVYADTPQGDWAQLRDVLREISRRERAAKPKIEKMRSGLPLDELLSSGDEDGAAPRARQIDPLEQRRRRALDVAAGNTAWRTNLGGRVRGWAVKGLSKILRRPGMADNFVAAFSEGASPHVRGMMERGAARLAPLRIAFNDAVKNFNRVVGEIVGNDQSLQGRLHAAVFDTLETQGRVVPPEAADFTPEQMARALEAGKRLGEEMLKIGQELENLDHLPMALFELQVDGEPSGIVHYVFKSGTLKKGASGEKPAIADANSPYKKATGEESIRAFESDRSLAEGESWKLVGGVEYYRRQGSWLKHMRAGAQLAESFGPIGTNFKRLWDGLFDSQTRKHFSRRTELDIAGKTNEYERSLRPTVEAGLSETAFLGTAFIMDEAERAGALVPEDRLTSVEAAAEAGRQMDAIKRDIARHSAELEAARAAWADERARLRQAGERVGALADHQAHHRAITEAKAALDDANAMLRDLRRTFESRRVGGNQTAGFERLVGPRWGKYEGWYLDRGVLHQLQSKGLSRQHSIWRMLRSLQTPAVLGKSVVGAPLRAPLEGLANVRMMQEQGVKMMSGDGIREDFVEALNGASERIYKGERHESESWREFDYLMEDSSLGGGASVENMDSAALRQAQRDLTADLERGTALDQTASAVELAVQAIQHSLLNAKFKGVDIGLVSRFAQHMSDTFVGYYAFLRLKRHGLEGAGPMSSADAAKVVKEAMDLRDVSPFIRALTSIPIIGPTFFRYRAKLGEGYTKSLGLPPSIYGQRIPMPWLDSAINTDPTSGKAAGAVAVRAAARFMSKVVEVVAPIALFRSTMLQAFGDEYEKKYKEGVKASFSHMPAPLASFFEAITVPIGEDEFGDPRAWTLDFLSPSTAIGSYIYNNGMMADDANKDRLMSHLFSFNILGSALYQTMDNTDWKGWKRGNDSLRIAPLLSAYAPGMVSSAWAKVDRAINDPLGRGEPIKDMAFALLGMRVKVAGAVDPFKAVMDKLYSLGHIDYIEYPSGGRKPVSVVDFTEDPKTAIMVKMLLDAAEAHPGTMKQLMYKIAREQENIVHGVPR